MNMPNTLKHNRWTDAFVIEQLKKINPSNVLDIGCGDGFFGKLCHYILDDKVLVTGLDANPKWSAHCTKLSEYSNVINDCVFKIISQLSGELAIAGDVLEHLKENEMLIVLDQLVNSFDYIIINAPIGFQPQEHAEPLEHHRCGLTKETFNNYNVLEYNEGSGIFNVLLKGRKNG